MTARDPRVDPQAVTIPAAWFVDLGVPLHGALVAVDASSRKWARARVLWVDPDRTILLGSEVGGVPTSWWSLRDAHVLLDDRVSRFLAGTIVADHFHRCGLDSYHDFERVLGEGHYLAIGWAQDGDTDIKWTPDLLGKVRAVVSLVAQRALGLDGAAIVAAVEVSDG